MEIKQTMSEREIYSEQGGVEKLIICICMAIMGIMGCRLLPVSGFIHFICIVVGLIIILIIIFISKYEIDNIAKIINGGKRLDTIIDMENIEIHREYMIVRSYMIEIESGKRYEFKQKQLLDQNRCEDVIESLRKEKKVVVFVDRDNSNNYLMMITDIVQSNTALTSIGKIFLLMAAVITAISVGVRKIER